MTEELPTPQEVTGDQYRKDLLILHKAMNHIKKLFGEESAVDYMISEVKEYVNSGKFSKHCYEYAEKNPLEDITEEELTKIVPKTWDGRPILSWRDL